MRERERQSGREREGEQEWESKLADQLPSCCAYRNELFIRITTPTHAHPHTHKRTHTHAYTEAHSQLGLQQRLGVGTWDTGHCCALPGKHLKNFCRTRVFRAASDSKTTADAAAEPEAAESGAAAAAEAGAAAEQPHNRTN